jgi:phage shock protein PspC (stress-responsive transcriptional regulator)
MASANTSLPGVTPAEGNDPGPDPGPRPLARAPLRRRLDEGLLGGVCAGIAERLQVNAAVVRVIAAASVSLGGISIALYALACDAGAAVRGWMRCWS